MSTSTTGCTGCLTFSLKESDLGFVLIRALEPIRRHRANEEGERNARSVKLCSGPGKLTNGAGSDRRAPRQGLVCASVHSPSQRGERAQKIEISPRVGISRAAELPWRFYAAGNPHVSHSYFVKIGRGWKSRPTSKLNYLDSPTAGRRRWRRRCDLLAHAPRLKLAAASASAAKTLTNFTIISPPFVAGCSRGLWQNPTI